MNFVKTHRKRQEEQIQMMLTMWLCFILKTGSWAVPAQVDFKLGRWACLVTVSSSRVFSLFPGVFV